jgi:hypothetical protein
MEKILDLFFCSNDTLIMNKPDKKGLYKCQSLDLH